MHLRTVEITGFKSFGKKVVISIDSPITGIVGPNGSGKSNVVEAIRFVLGEQSMKSLRGKGTMDLLFKGSKGSSAANKLKVTITFDNKERKLTLPSEMGKNFSVDFDTVAVSREFYIDGHSIYSIQGSEVRLKDVTELLSSVHIGASGYHIISQGEADRLLSASNKERRAMIDDALGLRVYEIRIRDSMRKLEKAKLNIAEIESARRELAPHINFLRKQVDKLTEIEQVRNDLSTRYFHYEKSINLILDERQDSIKKELFTVENELAQYKDLEEGEINQNTTDEIGSIKETIERIKGEKFALLRARETLERQLGRTEGLVEALKKPRTNTTNTNNKEQILISKEKFVEFCESINNEINNVLNGDISNTNIVSESLIALGNRVKSFLENYQGKREIVEIEEENLDNTEELKEALAMDANLRAEIEKNSNLVSLLEEDEKLNTKLLTEREIEIRSSLAEVYKARVEKARLIGEKSKIEMEMERLSSDRAMQDEEKKIFEPFLMSGSFDTLNKELLNKEELSTERRALERLRLKLEEVGGGSGGDIIKEYEETKNRDEYLRKELQDLNTTIESLLKLINELRETVRAEFHIGIDKINIRFSEFFKAMFGGGNAFLSLVAELKKPKTSTGSDLEEIETDLDNEEDESMLPKFERGVEIHVDLPNKKVRELNMLSGGERSLVSIALLFAISQVNPPPFLVLDETDAALDEANSRRYGDMLERLSTHTQLIVVTHNRETMSRSGTIYGVTMGADAVSKLLSIEFTEAAKIAK